VRDHRLRDEEIAVVATDEAIIAGNGDTDNKAIVSQSFTVEISIIAVILQSLWLPKHFFDVFFLPKRHLVERNDGRLGHNPCDHRETFSFFWT